MTPQNKTNAGFTLIEVLLALAVIAIALTALLKASSQDVSFTHRIKQKTISHWVALQAVTNIQLGIITIPPGQPSTHVVSMLDTRWYWRAEQTSTPTDNIKKITILVSPNRTGPFMEELVAFRYLL
jgi:general secretion pathway protein I